jgi:hypothetical protein
VIQFWYIRDRIAGCNIHLKHSQLYSCRVLSLHHRCENIPLTLVTIASYRESLSYSWAQFQCWSDHHGLAEDDPSSCGRGSLPVGITQWSWSIGECQRHSAVKQRNSSIRGEPQQQLEVDRYPPYFHLLDWWKFTSFDS